MVADSGVGSKPKVNEWPKLPTEVPTAPKTPPTADPTAPIASPITFDVATTGFAARLIRLARFAAVIKLFLTICSAKPNFFPIRINIFFFLIATATLSLIWG